MWQRINNNEEVRSLYCQHVIIIVIIQNQILNTSKTRKPGPDRSPRRQGLKKYGAGSMIGIHASEISWTAAAWRGKTGGGEKRCGSGGGGCAAGARRPPAPGTSGAVAHCHHPAGALAGGGAPKRGTVSTRRACRWVCHATPAFTCRRRARREPMWTSVASHCRRRSGGAGGGSSQ